MMTDTAGGVALNLRNFDPAARERARLNAASRGITLPAYFERLIEMHEGLLERAKTGDKSAIARLREVGLEPVTR